MPLAANSHPATPTFSQIAVVGYKRVGCYWISSEKLSPIRGTHFEKKVLAYKELAGRLQTIYS